MRVNMPGAGAALRGGFSLIEMLAVISLVGVLSIVGGRMLTLLLECDAAVAIDVARQLNFERLEDRFRRDVHAAASATVEETPAGPALTLNGIDGTQVRYTSMPEQVRREGPGTRRAPARETFTLSGGRGRFEFRPPLVQLVVEPAEEALDSPRTSFLSRGFRRNEKVIAILNRDRRLSAATETRGEP